MNDEQQAREAIGSVPFLKDYRGPVVRLGGLTNLVFRAGTWCLRVPGRGTEEYIDRANESVAAREAARVGVGPEVFHADAATGLMVTRFIDGAATMSPEAFRAVPGSPARAGEVLRRLHASDAVFPARFELFQMIDDYLAVLATKDVALPEGYHDVLREAETARAALAARPLPVVACHCDPLCENFLDVGGRMWVVDWEYSGMNDPMWDLGDLSVEAEFGAEQEEEMIRAYFGGEPPATDRGRIVVYKAMCDLLWTLWGLIQLANENPALDFRAYSDERFARCRLLMGQQVFAASVEAVVRG
jgi:thiamine kinase-like enzyme